MEEAGTGGLSVAVRGTREDEISCHDNKDGTISESYLPTAPGEYKTSVQLENKHIDGSPFNARIAGKGTFLYNLALSNYNSLTLISSIQFKNLRSPINNLGC